MLMSEARGVQKQLGIAVEILRASTLDEIGAAFSRQELLGIYRLREGGNPQRIPLS
jgi:hypothetical protein